MKILVAETSVEINQNVTNVYSRRRAYGIYCDGAKPDATPPSLLTLFKSLSKGVVAYPNLACTKLRTPAGRYTNNKLTEFSKQINIKNENSH